MGGELGDGSIVIQSSHSVEVVTWQVWSVVTGDHTVSVSWVTNNKNSNVSGSVVVQSLSGINEDSTVVLEQITSFHTWSSWLGTNQQSEIDVLETDSLVSSSDNILKKWEGTVIKFHSDTLEGRFGEWKINQVQNNWLVWSKHSTVGNSEEGGVSDVTSGSGDGNSNWLLPLALWSNELGE